MQLKWLEDFVALAYTRSFSRAAELRHVTHPAFGRRIKALEDWAGTPLLERGSSPVQLTAAGHSLLEHAQQTTQAFAHARDALQGAAGRQQRTVTLATGRTLARTLVADWLRQLQPLLDSAQGELVVRTRSLGETQLMLEREEADFMLAYHHPLLSVRLNARQYSHRTLAQDRLVPLTRCDALGQPTHRWNPATPGNPLPWLAYANTLALGRLLSDHLANHPQAPRLRRVVDCDSADALLEYALQGLGVAWLPWSLAGAACRAGQLCVLGNEALAVDFEVRLYRAKRPLSPLAEAVWQTTPAMA
jgi:DNA-binding transcriptional LysR family regulator